MAYIGIDLGTSTCEIAYYKDGKVELIPDLNGDIIIPSYIGVDQEGNFIYGRIAKNQFIARRRYTTREFKRLMGTNTEISVGDKQYSPEEVSAMMLAYLKKSAEVYLNKKIDEVIVTVPANFDDNQRSATMRAIQMSGLRCERIINEPTAASMTYGLDNIDEESTILVFDFGGGTLDITILEMFEGILDVKASHGDTQLGGKDFDERMKGIIIEKLRAKGIAVSEQDDELMAKIYSMAEEAKIALSNERKVSVQLENIRVGNELQDIEIEITRDEFEAKIEDLIKRAENLVMETIKAAGMEIEDINNVILVGGTTKVPVVRQRLSRLLNKILRTDVEPDTAVAKGAAIQIAIKSGLIDSKSGLLVTDVCPYSLGTETAEIMDVFLINGLYHEMIKRNTTIPCERTDVFVPLSPEQEIVSVKVYQTLNENCKLVKDAKLIGEFTLDLVPNLPVEDNEIELTYSYDINGTLKVSAKHVKTQVVKEITIDKSKIMSNDGKTGISSEQLQKSKIYRKYSSTIENVERKIGTIQNPMLIKELDNNLEILKQHIINENEELAEAMESKILDLLMGNGLL